MLGAEGAMFIDVALLVILNWIRHLEGITTSALLGRSGGKSMAGVNQSSGSKLIEVGGVEPEVFVLSTV